MTVSKERRRDLHFKVLRELERNPNITQRELAAALGVSSGGVHYILAALVDKGLVKLGNFAAASDKRRYSYILTRSGMAEKAALTTSFLARKRAEYAALREEIAALERSIDNPDENGALARE